jgi:hypothetical protein
MIDENYSPADNSLPPASPAEGPSVAPPSPPQASLLSNPILLKAATGKSPKNGRFEPGNSYGRPTVMTVEAIATLLRGLRTKKTISGAVAAAGIGMTTFQRHRRENREFAELCEIAEAHATALLVAKLIQACQGAADGKQRRDWRGYAWLLERRSASKREFAKLVPDAITHDVLANAISKVVSVVMPKIAEADRPMVLQAMEAVFADLKPTERDDDGS